MNHLLLVLVVFVVCVLLRFAFLKREPSVTASGAIVMGMGIFLYGAFRHFSWLVNFGTTFAAILFAIWVMIIASFIASVYKGEFRDRHIADPVNAFGIGTWVAGTSVMANVMTIFFSEWMIFLRILAVFNAALWLFYLCLCIRSFKAVFSTEAKNRVHGVVLLSTVSTQSIVILFHHVFPGLLPEGVYTIMIVVGIVLYITGLITIFRRFLFPDKWRLTEDWLPSNCIIHGAMSITGLAAASTEVLANSWILAIWLWVLGWFVIVEAIEGVRVMLRIKKYGIEKGFGEYHVTQWSRIFTFGMLYAFTVHFPFPDTIGMLDSIRTFILDAGPWVVLILLINEILLFLKEKVRSSIWDKLWKHQA
jgi:hypothetical protein